MQIGLVIWMIEKFVGAYCIYLGNNLISWSSKKQSINAKSSAKSEYKALASASAEISWSQSMQRHLLFCMTTLVPLNWLTILFVIQGQNISSLTYTLS